MVHRPSIQHSAADIRGTDIQQWSIDDVYPRGQSDRRKLMAGTGVHQDVIVAQQILVAGPMWEAVPIIGSYHEPEAPIGVLLSQGF